MKTYNISAVCLSPGLTFINPKDEWHLTVVSIKRTAKRTSIEARNCYGEFFTVVLGHSKIVTVID